jgi:sugar phosphate isomerase/epimerase
MTTTWERAGRLKLAYMVATPDIKSRNALGYHADIKDSTRLLTDLGYDGIELTTDDASAFEWAPVQAAIEAAGLEVPLVCSGEVFGQSGLGLAAPDEHVRAAAMERLKGLIDFAAIFGANVNIGRSRWYYSPDVPAQLTEGWALESFRVLADYAAAKDVTIALEPIAFHVCNFINSTQDGLAWLGRVGRPNFKLMLDLYHMNIDDLTSIEESIALAVAADAVVHVHLCDTNRKPPGYGHMDFAGALGALKRAGYTGYVSGEVFNYPEQDAAVRRCAEVFRPLL